MNGHLMIRPTCEKDAAALARIYAYYVEKTAITFEYTCLLYTSPSPRDGLLSRMPSSA